MYDCRSAYNHSVLREVGDTAELSLSDVAKTFGVKIIKTAIAIKRPAIALAILLFLHLLVPEKTIILLITFVFSFSNIYIFPLTHL